MADFEASKIDKANHLLLDQPLLRLPHELLRKNFRAAHFVVEKESVAVKNALKETATAGIKGTQSPDDILKSLDTMINRVRGAKRKLDVFAAEEDKIYRQVDARTAHLAELADMQSFDDVAYEAWNNRRLDRHIVDYMLRNGYTASANALVADDKSGTLAGIVDVDTFVEMHRIRTRLREGSVSEALAWCVDNKKELRKQNSKFEFSLRLQQFIELARVDDVNRHVEAIAHARKYLAPYHASFPKECQTASALLCYPAAEAPEAYAQLWSPDRWNVLADMFTETHARLLSLPVAPLLHTALTLGLSALKTPACHPRPSQNQRPDAEAYDGRDGVFDANGLPIDYANAPHRLHHIRSFEALRPDVNEYRNRRAQDVNADAPAPAPAPDKIEREETNVCPICSPELNELAQHVPYAQHSKSHVESDLQLLPNSRVYSRARLDEVSKKANLQPGFVKDPATGTIYSESELRKVFIS